VSGHAGHHPVDVVLLDILMPDLDGFQVLERIKDDPELRHIPVVMISGLEDIESVVRCIEMGAEDFLPKPFDPVILRARVNAGLDRMRLHQLERDRVREVFARFLPETVVDEVLARSGGELRLGAERMVGTVMFTDLRSFTTFAERADAEQVIEVLNHYLGDMGGAVLDHGGTLVDYMGDGIMAAFGAPIPTTTTRPGDRRRAGDGPRAPPGVQRVARRRGHLRRLRDGRRAQHRPVMSGNVGSERRLEYTVIGDTVNTASRIEALTKEVPFPVLVADETRAAMRSTSEDLVYVDEFEIEASGRGASSGGSRAAEPPGYEKGERGCAETVPSWCCSRRCSRRVPASSDGSEATSEPTASPAGDPNTDKLAQILDRGTLVAYYEPDYPPQSFAVEGAERPADTKCGNDQITAPRSPGSTSRPRSWWPRRWASRCASSRPRIRRSRRATGATAGTSPTRRARSTRTACNGCG